MSKTLVFGASGQLGQCLKTVADRREADYLIFPDEQQANILNVPALEALFAGQQPAYVINCAAYTAVDKAESDVETAYKVNQTGVENLARLCAKHNTVLVHVSTDFVFKGDGTHPLKEDDAAEPVSVYGESKLAGELAIPKCTEKYFIVRTGWLYSEYANNFVKTMIRLGTERDELKVIADQTGTPTYAIDLANVLLNIIESGSTAYGTYHYSNEGIATWYEFARTVFDVAGIDVRVHPIPTTEYPTPATRPKYSVMDKSKIKQTFNLDIPYWKTSLEACIDKLK